ncbi:high affinity methionine permease [Lepidopterella palustris CBS 459.81]|uniref:High affinity methionine permease n=1 Tax=Lepidopterella palustris CBS 459.81 TaxID=1314670 RepID=A0A8E2JE94_9PEZI|nr:high affinity methionine permease [Lepidopterella palustris CBS 459.81]
MYPSLPQDASRLSGHDGDDASSINHAIQDLLPANISNTISNKAPENRFRLDVWDVTGLVINRMIGSGIFNSPGTVMRGTHSVGASLLLWAAGAIYGICGCHVFIELGLTIPQVNVNGVDVGIPRSGGTIHYLQYAYGWPSYRPGTVRLIGCVYSLIYIIIGNVAPNCLVFGQRVLMSADVPVTNGAVRGIAISVATATCLIHAISRRGGIWLSNVFAVVKILILLLICITAICAGAGAFHTTTPAAQNMAVEHSFAGASNNSYGYTQAFLAVVFACSAVEQPTYVLGEIGRPHKTFPRGTIIGATLTLALYVLVNISYMVVVPKSDQLNASLNVAQQFFQLTFGKIGGGHFNAKRVFSAFLAISTFGNIVTFTFVAARVKQEIAKEGILPWPKFFGSSQNLSIGRVLNWLHTKRQSFIVRRMWWLLKISWFDPREHSEETPVGALVLHWAVTVFMILVSSSLSPTDAYTFLAGLYSYTVFSFCNLLVACAVLKLRFSSRENWRKRSTANPFLSVATATVFAICCAYPTIASWVPPMGSYAKVVAVVPWYVQNTVAWCVIGLGVGWYFGFLAYAARKLRKDNVEFRVIREADWEYDPPPFLVQVRETVYLAWVAKEASNRSGEEMSARSSCESF